VWKTFIIQLTKVIDLGYNDACFLAKILKVTIYLFAGKFSYIVLNKAVYDKTLKMSTK